VSAWIDGQPYADDVVADEQQAAEDDITRSGTTRDPALAALGVRTVEQILSER
jgi:hypothetical protein